MANPAPAVMLVTASVFGLSLLFGGTTQINTKPNNSKYEAERARIEAIEREATSRPRQWFEAKKYECVPIGSNVRAEVASYYAMPTAWLHDAEQFGNDFTLRYDLGSPFHFKTYTTSEDQCLQLSGGWR